ncbi:unnamed protein product [Schistosoma mattheei]|uniref:Uncharacterized protein n=1 Tax=Schistosoma mattheei TaxID=31246 RepID=A0AA85BSZ4_9TREM|nr:unnamed protein product [Schistosoma mattheei]
MKLIYFYLITCIPLIYSDKGFSHDGYDDDVSSFFNNGNDLYGGYYSGNYDDHHQHPPPHNPDDGDQPPPPPPSPPRGLMMVNNKYLYHPLNLRVVKNLKDQIGLMATEIILGHTITTVIITDIIMI